MRLNKIRRRREAISKRRDLEIIKKWQFINKIYDDVKTAVVIILVIALIIVIFQWVVKTEYGSFAEWWNSGKHEEVVK